VGPGWFGCKRARNSCLKGGENKSGEEIKWRTGEKCGGEPQWISQGGRERESNPIGSQLPKLGGALKKKSDDFEGLEGGNRAALARGIRKT